MIKIRLRRKALRVEKRSTAAVNVNVTMIFSIVKPTSRCANLIKDWKGVPLRQTVDHNASVARFFVSESILDSMLIWIPSASSAAERKADLEPCGKAAIANAKLLTSDFKRSFMGRVSALEG